MVESCIFNMHKILREHENGEASKFADGRKLFHLTKLRKIIRCSVGTSERCASEKHNVLKSVLAYIQEQQLKGTA